MHEPQVETTVVQNNLAKNNRVGTVITFITVITIIAVHFIEPVQWKLLTFIFMYSGFFHSLSSIGTILRMSFLFGPTINRCTPETYLKLETSNTV